MTRRASLLALAWLATGCPQAARAAPRAPAPAVAVDVVDPTSAVPILPTSTVPSSGGSALTIEAARGETVAASFVVNAAQDLDGVRLRASDLVDRDRTIPGSAIDLRVVKAWYQATYGWRSHGRVPNDFGQVLVPGLLLHDEAVVEVDRAAHRNYLRIGRGGHARRWWANPPRFVAKDYAPPTMGELPFTDAAALCPVALVRGEPKQLWVTVQVPATARPGSYRGHIAITAGARSVARLPVELEVLPFALEPAKLTYSLYYRAVLDPARAGLSSEHRTLAQMRVELADMLAHGVRNPTVYQPPRDLAGLAAVLKLRDELGLSREPLYLVGLVTDDPGFDDALRGVQALARPYGIPAIYAYGLDEVTGPRLVAERAAWQRAHELGARVFVAGSTGTFEAVGDLLDLFVHAWRPLPAEAAKWHRAGHAIVSYGNPQTGPANPRVWRQNYGVVLWAAGYDGAMPYAYQHCFGDCYNDLDDPTYRDHLFAYPTADGVIATLAWEGFREGVNDVRYLETLERHVAAALGDDDPARRQAAREADDYLRSLAALVNGSPTDGQGCSSALELELGAMRRQLISYTVRLAR